MNRASQFGLAFQKAAEMSGARTRHNAFEASVVEVRRDDLHKFLVRFSCTCPRVAMS